MKTTAFQVDIEHTYIGDLVVRIKPPSAMGIGSVTLHDQSGGGTQNLKKTFDLINTPGLEVFSGKHVTGTWTLEVQDKAKRDTGKILSFSVRLSY